MSFVVAGGGVVIGVAVPWLICKLNHLLLKRHVTELQETLQEQVARHGIPGAVVPPRGCASSAIEADRRRSRQSP
ncbi:hypothetical protein WME89_51895 [Sorangium sp. So ce321]|uniref:hypothetical protein n=1 Tax=Sorangium sp. So ce321 TaxID=3133300 RepID=UPI003F602454